MSEFISGILIGTGTTAFVLTMVWDLRKTQQQKKELQNSLLNLLLDELEYNFSAVKREKILIEQELNFLEKGQSVVNALNMPRVDFWEVFRLNYNNNFFSSEQIKIVKDIYFKIHSIIVNIESRENYRINNKAMDNFTSRMLKYDNILLQLFSEFEKMYGSFNSKSEK